MTDKIDKLKALLELSQNDTITPKEVEKFLAMVLSFIKQSKDRFETISKESLKEIENAVEKISDYYSNTTKDISKKTTQITLEFNKKISEAKILIEEIKKIEVKDGEQGLQGEKGDRGEVGEKGEMGSPDKPEEVRDKLEILKKDNRLDISAIKGLDKIGKDIENRAIGIVDQRTSFLINKVSNLKTQVDTLEASEGNWGQIGGTISSQTDLQTALNAKQDVLTGLTATVTELNYTDGVTSAIQTQLNSKGSGTVTAVSIATANGVSGSSSGGATPALTIALGAITPTSINGLLVNKGTNSVAGNTAVGVGALDAANSGNGLNTAMGFNALTFNTTGYYNTAYGYQALYSNTTGAGNTAIGLNILYFNTTGANNTACGFGALMNNTTGANNTASGVNALYSSGKTVTAGTFITGVSYTIISAGTTDFVALGAANNNVGTAFVSNGVGSGTGTAAANSNGNTAYGYYAGRYLANGSTILSAPNNSMFIGYDTRASADGLTNENVIGYGAIGNGSNSVTLGNTSVTKTILQGNVGIGTTAPNANAILDVTSTTKAFMPPRMTTVQKAAISTPTAGMVVYDSTLNKLCVYGAASWETITSV